MNATRNTQSEELNRQADMIEAVFKDQNIRANVTGGVVTPRTIEFNAKGANVDRVEALTDPIARSLHVTRADVIRRGQAVFIVIPRSDAKSVSLAAMLKRIDPAKTPIPPATALLGLADDGTPLFAKLPSEKVGHVLIEGGPHVGKTALLATMIVSLATYNLPRSLRIITIGQALAQLDRLPHVLKIGLYDLVVLVDKRHAEDIKDPAIVVAVDDLGSLDQTDRLLIGTLATRGPAVNVYFIGATREAIGRSGQWPTLITATQGADAGDFLIEPARGPVMAFVAAYAAPAEVDDLIIQLQAKK